MSSVEKIMEIPVANVARVDLTTEDEAAKTFSVKTASEMTIDAAVSEGEETELRKGNRLLALLKTDDLPKGYDLKFKDLVVTPPVFALIDGGTATFDEGGDKFQKYVGPKVGEVVTRTPFTTDIYTEEKDADGETVGYLKITCKHCKGSPASFSAKDGEFFSPEYTVTSRPKRGEAPMEIAYLDALPEPGAEAIALKSKTPVLGQGA